MAKVAGMKEMRSAEKAVGENPITGLSFWLQKEAQLLAAPSHEIS
jgi:hypothetical protein